MALLLLALALVATFGGGDAAPEATTAVPIAVCSCPLFTAYLPPCHHHHYHTTSLSPPSSPMPK